MKRIEKKMGGRFRRFANRGFSLGLGLAALHNEKPADPEIGGHWIRSGIFRSGQCRDGLCQT